MKLETYKKYLKSHLIEIKISINNMEGIMAQSWPTLKIILNAIDYCWPISIACAKLTVTLLTYSSLVQGCPTYFFLFCILSDFFEACLFMVNK